MNQRWPLLHRRASGLGSMTALRYTGLRLGAGKHLGKADGSSIGGEVQTTLRASIGSKLTLSTMPCFLERLGPVPCVGSGRVLGFRGFSPTYSGRPSLGLHSLSKRHLRCHKVGGRSSRLDFVAVHSKVERATKSNLSSRYLVNNRHVHIKHLRPFFFHGWPSLRGCSSLVREINSRSLVRFSNSGPLADCVAPSRDEAAVEDASVDEDGLSNVTMTSNFTEEVVWEKTITSTRSSPDEVECSSERCSVPESSWEESKGGSFIEGEHKVPSESQSDPIIIVFDIETTGFLKSGSKIVELACRDLAGGDRSTLETLVNPYQPVPLASTAVHRITSEMVNRDDIPSWTEVMAAFVDFVESRRKGSGEVILVAHNGRRFDVPFIMKECYECSMAIPSHWYFVDTIDLAKSMLKKRFGKTKLYNLQYLYYDCYNLPRLKDAHRAGVDVDMLASVFGKLLMDLEMPASELLDQAFKASDIELKPDLLLREKNDRYTSLSKEGDETLLEQSIAELIIHERDIDIEPDTKLNTSSEGSNQGQEIAARGTSSLYVKTQEHWESSTSRVSLSSSSTSEDSSTWTKGTQEVVLEDEGFAVPLHATASQLGNGNPKHSEELSTEGLNTRAEDVFVEGIQSDVTAAYVTEALTSATNHEELLGLSRDTSALDSGTTFSWEDKVVMDSTQDNELFEFEDALGLVRGNEEGLATSTFIVDQVKVESSVTSSLVPGDMASLSGLQVSIELHREESSTSSLSPGTCDDDRSFNSILSTEVRPTEDFLKIEGLHGLDSVQQSRPLSPAVGDGILHPLNIGGTLLNKKRGKRRGTGDVQTTATRNIAHTVADCEEQISLAEAAVIDMQNIKPVQPDTGLDLNGSSHNIQDEKQRGTQEQLHTSSVNLSLLSPMMKQYVETKRQRPKFLLLSMVGDFYEAFFEDAERLAHACNIRLSGVDGGKLLERKVPMAGVPHHKVDVYLRILLKKGIAVVKQDQAISTDSKGGTIIDRQVSAVLTPGTLLDEGMLEESCNNFLVAIFPHADENGTWGLAYSDISTGEFQATQGQGRSSLIHELQRLQPSEVVYPANVVCTSDKKTEVLRPIGMPSEMCYSSRPTSEFFPAAAEKRLHARFGEESLEAFGLLRSPHAIRAAGGLLSYVQETQKLSNEEIPLQKPSYYSTLDTMHMDDTVRSHLELLKTSRWSKPEGSLVWALDHTQTAMGGRLLRRWLLWPLINHELICRRHDAVQVFVLNHELRSQFRSKLASISDIERLASRIAWKRADSRMEASYQARHCLLRVLGELASSSSSLSMHVVWPSFRDLLILAQSINCLPSLAELTEGASSNLYFVATSHIPTSAVQWANKVEDMLAEELGYGVQAGKVVKAGVDPILDVLRHEVQKKMIWLEEYEKQERVRLGIPTLEVGFNKNSGHYISIRKNKLKEDSVPDDYQRLQSLKAEERFVTSPLLDCESSRLAAEARVYDREEELLRSLKEEMVSLLESVREYSQAVATLDVLCTFADLAVKRDYCRPHMLETGREITIIGGRHPVVELALSEDMCFVANSAYLGFDSASGKASVFEGTEREEKLSEPDTMEELTDESEKWWPRADLVLLTGPNASGKSCYLRQIGLIQLLAQAGSFVPAKFTRLSLADGLYTRVGAVDDLAAGQSTFRVEMVETANILNRATAHSLILLDEVGRGTSSREGGVIARAIIEYLSQIVHARTIFSTHYHDLHVLDQDFPNIGNYHFQATELENGEVMFDHAVMPGYAVKSYAISIGRGAGLPDWVCNRASELLSVEQESSTNQKCSEEQSEIVRLETSSFQNELDEDCGVHDSEVHDKKLVSDEVNENASCNVKALDSNRGLKLDLLKGNHDPNLGGPGEADLILLWRSLLFFFGEVLDTLSDPDAEVEKINGDLVLPIALETPVRDLFPKNCQQSSSTDGGSTAMNSTAPIELEDVEITTSEGMEASIVQVKSEEHAVPEEGWYSGEQLDEVWERVYVALQNQPATQALLRQKGSLVSVRPIVDALQVCVSASSLFVRKFQQPEHFITLESAFSSVLHQPVRLTISVLTVADRSPQ